MAGFAQFSPILDPATYSFVQKALSSLPATAFVPGSTQLSAAFATPNTTSASDLVTLAAAEKCLDAIVLPGGLQDGARCVDAAGNTIGHWAAIYAGAFANSSAFAGILTPQNALHIERAIDLFFRPLPYIPAPAQFGKSISTLIAELMLNFFGAEFGATSLAAPVVGTATDPAYFPTSKGSISPVALDFYWGTALSAFQSEGYATDSNWKRNVDRDGEPDPYGNSVEFWTRWPSDVLLARDLGTNTFRIGVSWARIEPLQGQFNETALRLYGDMMQAISDNGMTPMITLDHFGPIPGWAVDLGAWGNESMVEWWLTAAKVVVDQNIHLKPIWLTFNEVFIYVLYESYILYDISPDQIPMMFDRVAKCHNSIFDYIRAKQPDALVTSNVVFLPLGAQVGMDALFLDKIADKISFVGIDYYYGASAKDLSFTDGFSGKPWAASPDAQGLYYALQYFSKKFPDLPLFVTENGFSTDNNATRPDGITRGTNLMDNVYWNIIGYQWWSLLDNYEWGNYSPRYGLYTVDVLTDPTLARTPTDAVAVYNEVIKARGVPQAYKPTDGADTCNLCNPPYSCIFPVGL